MRTAIPDRTRDSGAKRKIFDWLKEPHPDSLPPFHRSFIDVDWEKSPLGPISTWPAQLHQFALLIFSDSTPACLHWGDEGFVLYNEPYSKLIGEKHPALQGQDPRDGYAEFWDHFEALLAKQRETGETVIQESFLLLLHRRGFLEETYFSTKWVPIIGPEGWIVGSYVNVSETTHEILQDRRLATVRSLSRQVSAATTIETLWSAIACGLEPAEKDVPMAMLYSVSSTIVPPILANKSVSGTLPPLECQLVESFGIPKGHVLAPGNLHAGTDSASMLPCFIQSMEKLGPVVIPISPEMKDSLESFEWRGYGPSTSIVVCPIIPMNSHSPLAFLVIGLNPHRPLDEDYLGFIDIITQQVTTPQLTAVILREEVERRAISSREDAMDRDRLYQELSESKSKFARFAQRAPVGLAVLAPDGHALSANELWRDLTQLQVGSNQVNWADVLAEGELEPVLAAWGKLVTGKRALSVQTRMRRPWIAPELDRNGAPQVIETYILLAMYPDLDERGEVVTVMSCITDITTLKWSETQLRRRMDQAIEMKRQQERFIDMTSHEMRNPLSALIGCADEIISSLNEYRASLALSDTPESRSAGESHLITEALEAADTIIYCAMHQKRIIDDILTLSRLDSNLLLVSPAPSQPIQLVRNVLKMFDAELKRSDIKFDFIERQSLLDLHVDWTLLDPSRVLQVLINLVTNSIKFTRTERKRHVTITLGASLTIPSESNEFGVDFVQKSNTSTDQTSKPEWGDGEVIYVSVAVTDTGRGLSEMEKKSLFHVFKQASPKTYTQYGGSGLGLFISRQLVEMQGGEIGVASEANKGSTFHFYIKTRRTNQVAEMPGKSDFQLLIREDALREACGTETSALPNGNKLAETQPSIRPIPSTPTNPDSYSILVVEDNLVNQKVLSKQLRKAGHVVNVANHGEEALDFIKKSEHWHTVHTGRVEHGKPLTIVLMDLEMPVMGGIACVRRIRELQSMGKICRHIPVVAVTANARKDQIITCLEAGMDDVTTKPYRLLDMLKQIEELVKRSKSGELDSLGQKPDLVIDK